MPESIAIIGATGLVGQKIRLIAESSGVPAGELAFYASSKSSGARLGYAGAQMEVRNLEQCDFSRHKAALFCVGDDLSAEHVPRAVEAGCAVVDKSNAFRMDPAVPLVVPGVNDEAVTNGDSLVANPNCTTIVMCHALGPLFVDYEPARLWAATYQSVSGSGAAGVEELSSQVNGAVGNGSLENTAARRTDEIAFNVLPRIGSLDGSLRASEEAKLVNETQKIMGLPDLPVMAHAVRVPVYVGHSIAATIEFAQPVELGKVEGLWEGYPNVIYTRDSLPTPAGSAMHDKVEVGRLRKENDVGTCISFFVCGDNLNIGAALNGWRILRLMARSGRLQGGLFERTIHAG